jgi:hypothetical protein
MTPADAEDAAEDEGGVELLGAGEAFFVASDGLLSAQLKLLDAVKQTKTAAQHRRRRGNSDVSKRVDMGEEFGGWVLPRRPAGGFLSWPIPTRALRSNSRTSLRYSSIV